MKEKLMYLRDGTRPFGAVARLEDGRLGWSLCGPNDQFRKALARRIALGRAEKAEWSQQAEMDVVGRINRLLRIRAKSNRPLSTDRLARVLAVMHVMASWDESKEVKQ